MAFTAYIHFQGTCRPAMQFYADLFGATELTIHDYEEMPDPPPGAREAGLVMHASMTAPGGQLMASDYPPGVPGEGQAAVSVSHDLTDPVTGAALFARLAEGGHVIMPFGPTFFSPGFGMVKDRFGTHWMLMVPQPPVPAG